MQYAGMHFISFHIWEQTREADPVFRFLGLPWNYDPLLLRLQTKKKSSFQSETFDDFDGWRISARAQARQSDWQME